MRLSSVLRSAVFAVVVLAISSCSNAGVQGPKGFDKKVYDSAFALYASSAMAGVQDRFLCTVTAYQKVQGGYLLIGAGHCTGANDRLPPDLTFKVSSDIKATASDLQPVVLLKSEMNEPLDYAVYFLPTEKKYPTISLGNESAARIGDATVDVNFSLGVAKIMSPGVISSVTVAHSSGGENDITGFFLVNEFDSHGASGSSVVSEKTHKVIGLVIAGWDGETMPSAIEPISTAEKQMGDISARLAKARKLPIPVTVVTVNPATPDDDEDDDDGNFPVSWANGHQTGHGNGSRGSGSHAGGVDRGRANGHEGGHSDGRGLGAKDHRHIDSRHDVRERGGYQDIHFGGFWFTCGPYEWPVWIFTDEVYFEMIGPDIWIAYDYDNPTVEVAVYVVE